jgi:hypothetical protein
MHMIRLLMAGVHVLRTGSVLVDVGTSRDRLLAVRQGTTSWESITDWAGSLQSSLAAAAAETRLPSSPDRAKIDQLLVGVREEGVK